MPKEIVDRRADYYQRAATNRSEDPWEWLRRVNAGAAYQRRLFPNTMPTVRSIEGAFHNGTVDKWPKILTA